MASLARTNKHMRRTESKKSHSWWWDSHISPKNSRWLAENLEEMDQSVKRMLKLIEEDGDSFAKKAEMYYQRRPQLISHVEEFYRMYRSLAERYDHVTGELRKNIPADLQSQGSGISDIGSELPSAGPSPRRKSGPRAAGFDVFLHSGGSSSDLYKEGDDSSTLDSESESDDSSVNNYSGIAGIGDDQGSRRKIIELEVELRDVKEKLRIQQVENSDGSFKGRGNGNSEDLHAKIAGYNEELRVAKEKTRVLEDEIARLKIEHEKYNSQAELESTNKDNETLGVNMEMEKQQVPELEEGIDQTEAGLSSFEGNIHAFEEELKLTKEKLHDSETQVAHMRHELENNGSSIQHLKEQLGLAQKDVAVWKAKLDREKREVSKLQDRIVRYKANLLDRDQEIRLLKETISNANQSLAEENSQLQAEISKLLKERSYLENNLKEWELRCQSSGEEIRRINAEKVEMEVLLGAEIELLKAGAAERGKHVEELNKSLDAFKLKYDMLVARRDELDAKVLALVAEVRCRDERIDQMNKHLHQLHMEHVDLIGGAEKAQKLVTEMRSRVEELEEEIERQKVVISEGAEEKREAIRQLCFSLEHYRNGYQRLRQAFVGHKRLPIMAS